MNVISRKKETVVFIIRPTKLSESAYLLGWWTYLRSLPTNNEYVMKVTHSFKHQEKHCYGQWQEIYHIKKLGNAVIHITLSMVNNVLNHLLEKITYKHIRRTIQGKSCNN